MNKFLYQKDKSKKYQILYLNGASSSGKTTLSRALQEKCKNPFLVIGIDQIIYMMPEKLNDWHNNIKVDGFSWLAVKNEIENIIAYEIHRGEFAKLISKAFKEIVKTLAYSGFYLIVDDVSFGKTEVDSWRNELKDFNVLYIAVVVSNEILEKREKERGDRKIGSAKWQANKVHKEVEYDLIINTDQKSIDEQVSLIKEVSMLL